LNISLRFQYGRSLFVASCFCDAEFDMDVTRANSLLRRAARLVRGHDYARADGRCRSAPEWLVLVINNFCNLHCKMCDVGVGESDSVFYFHLIGNERRNMPLELLETILGQAALFFPKPRIGLAYTEPLIHPRILDFCRAIVSRGFFCSITTNGWLLPRLAEALADIGVHEIIVSIDGPEEIHDRVRRRQGSFGNLYQGVEQLNRAKTRKGRNKPLVRFSYTMTDENYTRLLDFVRQIEGLRPASINFSHLNFISAEMAAAHNARYNGELAVSRSNLGTMDLQAIDIAAMWRALQDLKAYARFKPDFPSLSIVPDFLSLQELQVHYRNPRVFVGGRNCTDPWTMLLIKTDGAVIPAHGRCYNFPIGNVTETPLPELWNNARFRAFRKILKDAGGSLPACARCCGVIGKPRTEEATAM
jgi:MoaA/NifB/PqqE/SkfB family radical SAM enzyme